MIQIYGRDTCSTCKTIRKRLMMHDITHEYHELPPGPKGYQMALEMSGSHGIPVVKVNGRPMSVRDFVIFVNGLELPLRELTQEELDEIE